MRSPLAWSRRGAIGLGAAVMMQRGGVNPLKSRRAYRTIATTPPPFGSRPRIMVAGGADGALAGAANLLKSRMDALLPPDQSLQIERVGGDDGVTAANRFDANVAPDGETALLVSGAAALSWLRGDPRAQYDIGHWLPIATAQVSGVVIASEAGLQIGPTLRLAVAAWSGQALAAQLGLHLLGRNVTSVSVSGDPLLALSRGQADVAFVVGRDAARRSFEATSLKMTPLFSLGSLDLANQLVRDPDLPQVPTLLDVLAARQIIADPELLSAWRCLSAAARLDVALVLPWLTPANVVAWWRSVLHDVQIGSFSADTDSIVWHTDPTGNFGLTAMIADAPTSLAFHRWLTLLPN